MCEANVYLLLKGEEELIMKSVDIVKPESESVFIQDIFGQQRWVKGHIKEITGSCWKKTKLRGARS